MLARIHNPKPNLNPEALTPGLRVQESATAGVGSWVHVLRASVDAEPLPMPHPV